MAKDEVQYRLTGDDKAPQPQRALTLTWNLLCCFIINLPQLVFFFFGTWEKIQAFLAAEMCCSRLHYRHHHKKHFEGSHQVHSSPQLTFFGLRSSGIIDQAPQGGVWSWRVKEGCGGVVKKKESGNWEVALCCQGRRLPTQVLTEPQPVLISEMIKYESRFKSLESPESFKYQKIFNFKLLEWLLSTQLWIQQLWIFLTSDLPVQGGQERG